MIDFKDITFIYGSFDFLRKGLSFAMCGNAISDDERAEVSKIIEKIGNYSANNSLDVQWLSTKISNQKQLLLAFSFGGKDEHGRKTFISKGFLMPETEFVKLHNNPFFVLPNMKIDYNYLKEEVTKNVFKTVLPQNIYDLTSATKVIERNYESIRNLAFLIWSNVKVQLPSGNNYLDMLNAVYLITPIKERKTINFITCASQFSESVNVRFSDSIDAFYQKSIEVPRKSILRFDFAIEVVSSNNLEGYLDFLFGRKKKNPKKIVSLILKIFKKKQS